MKKKRIYIAGCGGMLGDAFYRIFNTEYELRCTDIDQNETWISLLDFRDFAAYRKDVIDFKPDYLFHLGAHTDLEYCENNIEDTYLTNTVSVENAVYISNELNIPLLYISTAGIFDGNQPHFDDWDTPKPHGHYARSKYMGETFVKDNKKEFLVVRAGWMMGGGPRKDKKFIQKLMVQLKDGKKELFIVNDKIGSPTYTIDFARNVKVLLEKELWGVYNMSCRGTATRVEIARELLKILRIDEEIKVNLVPSVYFKEKFFAHRPQSESLLNTKLDLRGLNVMREWNICLKEYIEESYAEYM